MKPKAPKKSVASEREELVQCLRLQEEIDSKLDELVKRFKAVSRAHPNEEVVIEINGILYKLGRPTWEQELRVSGVDMEVSGSTFVSCRSANRYPESSKRKAKASHWGAFEKRIQVARSASSTG